MIILLIIGTLFFLICVDRTANRDKQWLDTDNSPYYYQETEERFYDPYEYEIAEKKGKEFDLFFDQDGKPIFVEKGSYR